MKNATIEEVLTTWFYTMLDDFADLSFRYKYNESRGVYMVSYDAPTETLNDEKFCDCIIDFEDSLDSQFGLEAPLFTEKDLWFKLSDNANMVRKKQKLTVDNMCISIPIYTQMPNSNKAASFKINDKLAEHTIEFSYIGKSYDKLHKNYTMNTPLTILAA